MGCQVPGCNHQTHAGDPFHLHARCHPKGGLEVAYLKGQGLLRIGCHKCKQPVADIEVAP